MSFDFDTPPDRRGTDSQKWLRYAGRDVLPLWVADTDFKSPPAVIEALRRRVDHGIFGYARPVASTIEAVLGAFAGRYGWKVDPSWLVWLPGLVSGLSAAIEAFSEPGDEVLCLTPVYPPFMRSPVNRGRVSVKVPLALSRAAGLALSKAEGRVEGLALSRAEGRVEGLALSKAECRVEGLALSRAEGRVEGLAPSPEGAWSIDWDALERAVTPRSKILLLCHPHNPVGRVWQREELLGVSEFCARRGLRLFSDEIHCDLMLDGGRHLPTACLSPEIAARTLTFMAPSKTYNLPGLGTSLAIVPDPALRGRLVRAAADIVPEVNVLGYVACEAACRDGEPWRQELLAYLRGNRDLILETLARDIPRVRIEAPIQATYLAWLNVEALGLSDPAAHFEAHGLGLSDGFPFGVPRGRAVRLNFGCPRSTLVEALRRMKAAVERT